MADKAMLCSLIFISFANPQPYQEVVRCVTKECPHPPINCFYIDDTNGCPTCHAVCSRPGCPKLNCTQPCFNGYHKDMDGCNTCLCKPGCPKKVCPRSTTCLHGLLLDTRGCPTCQCQPPPLKCHKSLECPAGVCPTTCSCRPFCDVSTMDNLT